MNTSGETPSKDMPIEKLEAEEAALRWAEEKRIQESKLEAVGSPKVEQKPLNQDG